VIVHRKRFSESLSMKIAFVGGFAFEPKGTIPLRAHPLAAELVKAGHELTIFLPPYDNPQQSGREWDLQGVTIKNIKVGKSALSYPVVLRRLIRTIESYKPAAIHIFKPKGFAGAVASYFLLRGVRSLIVDCDDWEGWGGWNEVSDYPWIVKEYIDRQERWLMRSAPAVTVASKALYDRAAEQRGSAKGLYYIPNCGVIGRDLDSQAAARAIPKVRARQELGLPDRPTLFYNGHFKPGDETDFFCRAAAPVAQRYRASLVFVGEGPELAQVKLLMSEYTGIETRYFPRLPYGQFIRLVGASDIAALPYADNPLHRAKCATRIIDYMSMGKAVITSAVGQNREYIVDGESGILSSPGNVKDFADKLELLLGDPALCSRLGQAARKKISETFSWNKQPLQECLAAYEQLNLSSSSTLVAA
jgi:glycosyltransferase involved in cell wall biosynthesis